MEEGKFSPIAMDILKARYLWKRDDGTQETPDEMFKRVADTIADNPTDAKNFFEEMSSLRFLPNSPTLMNAGKARPHGQLSACYVVGIEDSMPSICEALRKQMLIHKSGGGTGFDFTPLRPKGSKVNSTNGVASGVVSFMSLFDKATDVVQQGGMRRGANMAVLSIDHPEIKDFITAKVDEGQLQNFNISVAVTDAFMANIFNDEADDDQLRLFNLIVDAAWRSGDPGLIFIDTINQMNPTPELGRITATNPCGETPLYADEACNLGSINLSKFYNPYATDSIDWNMLKETVKRAVTFLDRVIDVNQYPLPEIAAACKRTRKIGLGVMGWADLLIKMHIVYGSEESFALADLLMGTINYEAELASTYLSDDTYIPKNVTRTCIAPTGTLSLIAGCSSGIEPNFAYSYNRLVLGKEVELMHPLYKQAIVDYGYADPDLFVTAFDVVPSDHVEMQAVFQKHTDLAVSKTVNLPHTATRDDIAEVYIHAWLRGCKGITVYRDRCKQVQVISTPQNPSKVCLECQI